MSARSFILYVGAERWRMGCVVEGKARLEDVDGRDATAARRALERIGWQGQAVVLALPTAWCFSASISLEGLPPQDRVAMGFRFEEQLPLSAEELVSDFVMGDSTALAVGARLDQVREVIALLESVGVAVQSASPGTMLAAQQWARECIEETWVVLAAEGEHCNVLVMRMGHPAGWALCRGEDVPVQVGLMLDGVKVDAVLRADVTAEVAHSIQGGGTDSIEARSLDEAAAHTADCIFWGRMRAWVEFRRGPLALRDRMRQQRKAMNALLGAACVLLIVGSAIMLYRAQRYERLAKQRDHELVQAFAAQFPDWQAPANVRTVLESERRKRMAQTNGDLPAAARTSALETMRGALAKVPADLRISIDRMTFSDQTFMLQGKARSMEDADALAKAARQGGLEVPPPLTRKEADGSWGFTLNGGRAAAQRSVGAKE